MQVHVRVHLVLRQTPSFPRPFMVNSKRIRLGASSAATSLAHVLICACMLGEKPHYRYCFIESLLDKFEVLLTKYESTPIVAVSCRNVPIIKRCRLFRNLIRPSGIRITCRGRLTVSCLGRRAPIAHSPTAIRLAGRPTPIRLQATEVLLSLPTINLDD